MHRTIQDGMLFCGPVTEEPVFEKIVWATEEDSFGEKKSFFGNSSQDMMEDANNKPVFSIPSSSLPTGSKSIGKTQTLSELYGHL